jgi:hypothetical protein
MKPSLAGGTVKWSKCLVELLACADETVGCQNTGRCRSLSTGSPHACSWMQAQP